MSKVTIVLESEEHDMESLMEAAGYMCDQCDTDNGKIRIYIVPRDE
jgi:hypothetical protein